MAAKVFISYRRADANYPARMVYNAFRRVLPRDSVFMDVDSIPPGADFVETLEGWVEKCEILLALIGPGWADAIDPKTSRKRLQNDYDFVRVEIREALKRGIHVVPVLLDGTPMPEPEHLPDDLKRLVRRQAEFVDFRTFDADVERLIKKLGMTRIADAEETGAGRKAEERRRKQEVAQRQAEVQRQLRTATPELTEQLEHVPSEQPKTARAVPWWIIGGSASIAGVIGIVIVFGPSPPVTTQPAPNVTPKPAPSVTSQDASAAYSQGERYSYDQGLAQDYAKARERYEEAAANGNADAMFNLGLLYFYGRGVPQDYAKAREWYEKAAAKDDMNAMTNLGWLYEHSLGDYAKAREWYEKAAAQLRAKSR